MTVLQQWPEPRPILLTVADFSRLHEAGAFVDYPKTELIEGVIVSMSPQHRRHSRVKTELSFRLRDALAELELGLLILVEVTVALPPHSAPEPDIVLTDADADDDGFVDVAAAKLVIEVADSTAAYDLGRKSRLYAEAGVREYWVVDLGTRALQRFADPHDGTWKTQVRTNLGDAVEALTLPGLTIDTAGLC